MRVVSFFLCSLFTPRTCLLRDNDRHDQIDQRNPTEACEESQQGQQADDGWVNAKIFAQSCAHARDHAVGRTAGQLLVVGIHDVALLSMISIGTYVAGFERLQGYGGG